MSDKKIDYLDLNQENVLYTYKECLVPKEYIGKYPEEEYKVKIFTEESCGKDSPEIVFNNSKLYLHSYNIAHLLGQLKVTHEGLAAFTLPMGFINFKNEPWTKDNTTLMALYYLGVAADFIPIFKKIPGSDKVMSTTAAVFPSFPKGHPKFVPLFNEEATSTEKDQ
ncbi:MAG: hypothetical protein IJO76_02660 [Clostridia bacterium]|nr:hypothetical protein [Clostridia bacterium]